MEYIPEMHHCNNLRSLTLVNVRVSADFNFNSVEVSIGEVSSLISTAFGGGARSGAKAYSMFFSLIFRHSSCQVRPSITHVSMGQVA